MWITDKTVEIVSCKFRGWIREDMNVTRVYKDKNILHLPAVSDVRDQTGWRILLKCLNPRNWNVYLNIYSINWGILFCIYFRLHHSLNKWKHLSFEKYILSCLRNVQSQYLLLLNSYANKKNFCHFSELLLNHCIFLNTL